MESAPAAGGSVRVLKSVRSRMSRDAEVAGDLIMWDTVVSMFGRAFGRTPNTAPDELSESAKDTNWVRQVRNNLEGARAELEAAAIRIGVIGEAGSGKSSLINAIMGRAVAHVDDAEHAHPPEGEEYEVDGFKVVDLPGCGTQTYPKETYIERLRLRESYDAFILVTANRVKEDDIWLYAKLHKEAGIPFFVVRSLFDLAVKNSGEQKAREKIAPYIRGQLGASPTLPVYMVSTPEPALYDLTKLMLDVRECLPEWKQVRFVRAVPAYGREMIEKKREAAVKIVGVYAGLSAANGLNPIQGLNVAVDVGLLTTMAGHVVSTFGLRPDQVEALDRIGVQGAAIQAIKEIAKPFVQFMAKEYVVVLLKRMGARVAVKSAATWIPFAGNAVAAVLGLAMTYSFGENLISECETAANRIVELIGAAQSGSN